jgi:dTMP kinase
VAGLFVTFEGGEGSGKSTQMARLDERLRRSGFDPLVVREPGGTRLAESIRALLLATGAPMGAMTEALLMVAARSDLVATRLRPALEAGRIVLCDRYTDSTLAYQGGGRGLDGAMLASWNRAATGGLQPDLTLLFDLDPELGLARRVAAHGGTNRIDLESETFHGRVRERYLQLARAEPARITVLDADRPAPELAERVWSVVAARLPITPSTPA